MLDALQGALQLGLQQVPELAPLAKQITRKDFKDGQVLSISLSGSLIPLDKIEGEAREIVTALVEALSDRKLVISLGLRAKTLLLAVSSEGNPLLEFGQGEKLIEHERIDVLRRTCQRICGVSRLFPRTGAIVNGMPPMVLTFRRSQASW